MKPKEINKGGREERKKKILRNEPRDIPTLRYWEDEEKSAKETGKEQWKRESEVSLESNSFTKKVEINCVKCCCYITSMATENSLLDLATWSVLAALRQALVG